MRLFRSRRVPFGRPGGGLSSAGTVVTVSGDAGSPLGDRCGGLSSAGTVVNVSGDAGSPSGDRCGGLSSVSTVVNVLTLRRVSRGTRRSCEGAGCQVLFGPTTAAKNAPPHRADRNQTYEGAVHAHPTNTPPLLMQHLRTLALVAFGSFLLMACAEELVAHTCTTACEHGTHEYAHGEEGHVCDDRCKYLREQRR
jgi:hypothetical protein